MSRTAARTSTLIASFALLAFWWAAIVGPPGLVEQVTSDVLRSPQGQKEVSAFVASTMVKAGFDADRAPAVAEAAVSNPQLAELLDSGAGTTRAARAEEAVRAATSAMPVEDANAVAVTLSPLLKSASGWGDRLNIGPLHASSIHAVLLWGSRAGFVLAAGFAVTGLIVGPRRAPVARRVGHWSFRASVTPVSVLWLGPIVLGVLPNEWAGLGAVALRSAAGTLLLPHLALLIVGVSLLVTASVLKRRSTN